MPKLPPVHRYVSQGGIRVYRIPLDALPGLTGRVYLLVGAGPPTLVDAGIGEGRATEQLLAGLETVGARFGERVGVGDVKRILITHAHVDHFGGLAEMVDRTGAEVGVHRLDRRTIEAYDERAVVGNNAFKRFLRQAGVAADRSGELIEAFGHVAGRVRSVAVDFTLGDGQQLDGLRILHTPGHSPGHVCIAADDILLAGDHVLARTLTQQWPESVVPCTGLARYLESLDKVNRAGQFSLALGGHELPIRNVAKRIEEARSSQLRRVDRMLDILRDAEKPLAIGEIAERMYSHQEGFRAMLAVTDVGARVEYLDQRGELAVANVDEVGESDDPVYRYRPVFSPSTTSGEG